MTTHGTENHAPPKTNPTNRNHTWLNDQLDAIWQNHFADVAHLNQVVISWGRSNRTRLGTITAKHGPSDNPTVSEIRLNSLLRDETVPLAVVWQTIAHELAHYTHGFCSPHPRKYRHPHRGNVIERELVKRNLGQVYNEAQAWLKDHWHPYVATSLGRAKPRQRKRRIYERKSLSLLPDWRKIFTS